ncbi:MAG: rod shape-determining protein MreD [Pseudomonadota bacterium]|nr:MAG: rod shape-determining protein MreD [Pseudomonadota bacterium]
MIVASFVAALLLTLLPLSGVAAIAWPEWVALVLIYWCMALPGRVGVGTGWMLGLLLDVVRGALLGQHALALAVVAYLTLKLHQRVRLFPLAQQAVTVLVVMTLYYLITLWIKGLAGKAPDLWLQLTPSISTALMWPAMFVLMRFLRRHYRVA